MTDAGTLGRALIEAGKAISAQAVNASLSKGGMADPAQALLPKVDLMNKKLSAVEDRLSSAPLAITEVSIRFGVSPGCFRVLEAHVIDSEGRYALQGVAAELRDGVESLTQSLEHLRHELIIQNRISQESLEINRDLKRITHLMSVRFSNAPPSRWRLRSWT